MEQWSLYTGQRVRAERTMHRGEKIPVGLFHQVVHACVFNPQGQMLIQQRQPFKKGWSNRWDVTMGGSAIAGEESWQACQRELQEEVGISVQLQGVHPALTLSPGRILDDYYLLDLDVDAEKLHLQPEEVQAVKWADEAEILRMIDEKTFIPYQKEFIAVLFNLHSRGTVHTQRDNTMATPAPIKE